MADPPRKALFPNPFYVLLIVASTVFTLTVLAYLVSPYVVQRERENPAGRRLPAPKVGSELLDAAAGDAPAPSTVGTPDSGSLALAVWFDRRGPFVLAVEIGVMFVSGVVAMLTDRWFTSRVRGPTDGAPGREA
jgi:hypothetical protein